MIVYIDLVDWQHELGHASDGNKVFPSIEDLKKHRSCWKQCGIAEIEVTFRAIVEPQNFNETV